MSVATTTTTGARPARAGRRLRVPAWLGTIPFLGYVGVFLLWPTAILVVDAFKNPSGSWNFGSLSGAVEPGGPRLLHRVVQAVRAVRRGRGGVRGAGRLRGGLRQTGRRDTPVLAGWLGRAGPVRRGHPGLRLPGPHRPGWAAVARQLVLRLPMVNRADLHLLPDPAHGAGVPAGDRRAQAPVARGVGEPGLVQLAVLAVRGRPTARPGVHRRLPAAVRQRAVRVRHHPGVGEPDRLHGAAADQHRTVQRGRAG